MRTWVEFMDFNLSGKLDTPCGSDSYCFLDGRKSRENLIEDSREVLSHKLNKYPHFKILRGYRFLEPSQTIYSTI